jgi:FlaG/FlaF family flagellin (archaellin)
MIAIVVVAVGVLVAVLIGASDSRSQPLPQNPPTTQEDCGCGVPSSPRGPR